MFPSLQQGEYGLDEHKLHMYLSALQSLIPALFAVLLQNAPFTSRANLQGDVPPIEGEGRPTSTCARTRFSLTFSVRPRLAMQTWRLTQCNCRVPAMLRLLSGFGLTIKVLFHLRSAAVSDDLCSYAFFWCIPGFKVCFCVCVRACDPAVTRFPRPASPLQDVATIMGSQEQLAVLLQLYDHQLQHEGTTGWDSLLWVVNQL